MKAIAAGKALARAQAAQAEAAAAGGGKEGDQGRSSQAKDTGAAKEASC